MTHDEKIVEAVARERWLPVVGWEGYYEVSDMGQVRSVDRIVPNGGGRFCSAPGRLLSPRLQMHGYLCVTLRRGRAVRKIASVHRLVAAAFIPNSDLAPNINHIDCDRANNVASNLEWCTQAENLAHMAKLGRASKHAAGKRPSCACLTDEQVRQMRKQYLRGGTSHADISAQYGVSKKTVTNALNRRTYSDVL